MTSKLKRYLPAAIIGFGIIIFIILKTTRPESVPVHSKERVWNVDVVDIHPQRLAPRITLYGKIETPDLMKAAAPDNSRVQKVLVREGDKVSSGQLLLSLDERDFKPFVLQAEARVVELKADISSEELRYSSDKRAYQHELSLLNLSHAAVKRAKKMKTKKLGSDAALDQSREINERQSLALTIRKLAIDDHQARSHRLQARLDQAQANLEIVTLNLERSQIQAPFSGYVAKVNVGAGDQVNANQHLLSLYPTSSLEVRAMIPSPLVAELQQSLSHGKSLYGQADLAGKKITLKLDRLSGEADPRGIDALFSMVEGADVLRLGSRLSVNLYRTPVDDAIALPYRALFRNHQIYTLKDGRMLGVTVKNLGEYVDDSGKSMVLISAPALKSGDQVIMTHLPNAMTGLKVNATTITTVDY